MVQKMGKSKDSKLNRRDVLKSSAAASLSAVGASFTAGSADAAYNGLSAGPVRMDATYSIFMPVARNR